MNLMVSSFCTLRQQYAPFVLSTKHAPHMLLLLKEQQEHIAAQVCGEPDIQTMCNVFATDTPPLCVHILPALATCWPSTKWPSTAGN